MVLLTRLQLIDWKNSTKCKYSTFRAIQHCPLRNCFPSNNFVLMSSTSIQICNSYSVSHLKAKSYMAVQQYRTSNTLRVQGQRHLHKHRELPVQVSEGLMATFLKQILMPRGIAAHCHYIFIFFFILCSFLWEEIERQKAVETDK